MSIEFHCNHCGKVIKTGGDNAGKRGKCPYCKNSVYIPTPSDQIEPLELAPLDEEEQKEKERQLEETRRVAEQLRQDKSTPPPDVDQNDTSSAMPAGDARLKPDMETLVLGYAKAMAEGNLSEAEDYANDIRQDMDRANEVIDRILSDEIPPAQLASIPPAVLRGFFKQLRGNG